MAQDSRGHSRQKILAAIRKAGRIARIDLSRETGISQATVTTITADMLRTGLIAEVSGDDPARLAKRGRPRVDLVLRGEAHLVAGLKIGHDNVTVALMDFAGEVVGDWTAPLPQSVLTAETFSAVVAQSVSDAAEHIGRRAKDVSGVGIGLAGFVDAPRGFVHWSPSLDMRNLPLREHLEAALGCAAFIDNDANLVAVAEQHFGEATDTQTFIVVTIESGVGMGIVLDGELYRGDRGCGAEFGHTKVQLDGALCRCGQRGCLEAYVANYALLREGQTLGYGSLEGLMADATQGHALARSILRRAGRMFAMGLANLINVFDPQRIILAGERLQADHLLAEEVLSSIHDQIVQVDMAPPEIVVHSWDDNMWAWGAAAYAIDQVADMSLRGEVDAA